MNKKNPKHALAPICWEVAIRINVHWLIRASLGLDGLRWYDTYSRIHYLDTLLTTCPYLQFVHENGSRCQKPVRLDNNICNTLHQTTWREPRGSA